MKRRFSLIFLLGLAGLPCVGQSIAPAAGVTLPADAANQAILESLLHAPKPELVFRPDDILTVQVYGITQYAVQQQVDQDGSIAFPLVGKIQVAGLTIQQLESTLASSLATGGMVQDPQVTVTAVARPSAIVTVSGDVAKPGTFPAYGNGTLMDYLSEAGGLNDSVLGNSPVNSPASSTVTLFRPSLGEPVSIPLGTGTAHSPYANIPLFAGDQIRVGTVGIIYAVGAFKSQGAYPLKNTSPTTILQLVSMAGGIGFEADRKDAHLIRAEGSRKYILDLDVAGILKGKIADVPLRADDILFVPTDQMKAAIKGGGAGIIVGIASSYLYAHP